jgi:hypothetical protein
MTLIIMYLIILISFFIWENDFQGDIKYYYHFVSQYPFLYTTNNYGYYSILYLPSFYLFFKPFTYLPILITFYLFLIFNHVSIIYIFVKGEQYLSNFKYYITVFLCMISIPSSVFWGNIEFTIFAIHFYYYIQILDCKKLRILDVFILSFFSFKIISFCFIFLIILQLNKKEKWLFFSQFLICLIILNIYFIWLNPELLHISKLLEIYNNQPPILQQIKLHLIYRISMTIPFCFILNDIKLRLNGEKINV